MFRKLTSGLLALLIIFSSLSTAFGREVNVFDTMQLQKGIVRVNYTSSQGNRLKVMIQKGENKYFYDLKDTATYPLQFGNGEYIISILENVEENKYKLIKKESVILNLKNSNEVFLNSIDRINWNNEMAVIKKAKQLTKNTKNDEEKVKVIYKYITENIKYDNKKINKISSDYLPDIEAIYGTSSGLCYDYAALFAGMLRSVGVPTKLLMGYKNDVETYHAWNSVYIKELNQWLTVDTTYDSIIKNKESIYKSSADYKIVKYY